MTLSPTSDWSPAAYAANAAFVPALGQPVVALLASRAGSGFSTSAVVMAC